MRRRILQLTTTATSEPTLKVVRDLDAFPKVPETYKETSVSGGGVSILTFTMIAILIISECHYFYSQTKLVYDYEVDKEFGKKVKINVDITVAMKCHQIGADIVDITGAGAETFGQLEEEETYFELSPVQKFYMIGIQEVNTYIRSEYSAMHEILWKTGYTGMMGMPARETPLPDHKPDSCRLHGSLVVNKVAGNFHVTIGKNLPIITNGHAHLSIHLPHSEYNFSHRIDQFSFGQITPGIVNPLDGTLKIADSNLHLFNYFIEIVPTLVKTRKANVDTFQYAASERNRSIDHSKGSHGVPGIFMKYDVSSFKVAVHETHESFVKFIIRLIGIVGGVFVTSGVLHGVVQSAMGLFYSTAAIKSDTGPPPIATSLTSDLKSPPLTGGQIIVPPTIDS